MKRLLLGLAASAAMISVASGAFASAQLDNAQNCYRGPTGFMTLAQAAGGTSGNAGSSSGPEPAEQVGGKRKTETEMPAPKVNPDATDKTGASDTVDPSQSKRKSTTEPAQSGSK